MVISDLSSQLIWYLRHPRALVREEDYLWRMGNRVALSRRERISILGFIAKIVLAKVLVNTHLTSRAAYERDTRVLFQGIGYSVGLRSGEFATVEELYAQHMYDRDPDFIPQPGWTVFDIGANVGMFSVQQALRGASVYAFEPNPDCFRRMQKTIVASHLTNRITPFRLAVGSKPGIGFLNGKTSTDRAVERYTVYGFVTRDREPPNKHDGERTQVRITSLDHLVSALDIRNIDLLKIDTEGSEGEILEGAQQTLRHTSRVLVECHSHELRERVTALLEQAALQPVLYLPTGDSQSTGTLYARSRVEACAVTSEVGSFGPGPTCHYRHLVW